MVCQSQTISFISLASVLFKNAFYSTYIYQINNKMPGKIKIVSKIYNYFLKNQWSIRLRNQIHRENKVDCSSQAEN